MMNASTMRRDARFSFACARCGRCCHDQAIQLNGYEIARLARALGLCTTETIAKHTTNAGQFLRFGADGACAFLRAKGCAVHADRPLACRLYPLGREGDAGGEEVFAPLEPHPQCAGAWGEEGRVGDYLDGQGAGPFLAAFDLYQRAALDFLALPPAARALAGAGLEWLNLDWALAQSGLDVLPADPWRKMELHLAWVRARLDAAREAAPSGQP
jgi:Fe-S-cluster containining protein